MNSSKSLKIIDNANMSTYDIAHSIYLATVEGVSGANQNGGYGFALSAIAELWNLRGSIGNPEGRTKITGRYKGMGVTEDMIINVVMRYPDGVSGYAPTFDELLGIGLENNGTRPNSENNNRQISERKTQNASDNSIIIAIIAFIILKFFVGYGWIISIIFAILLGALGDLLLAKR